MQHRLIEIVLVLVAFVSSALSAEAAGKGPELKFDTPEGAQAFEAGKAAFKERKLDVAAEQFAKARKAVGKSKETQKEVERWVKGTAGMQELAVLQRNLEKEPGWVYENAQRKFLVYIATPAADSFRQLLARIEGSEKKLVVKFEGFEDNSIGYRANLGRTYVNKAAKPQYVIEGEKALEWKFLAKEDGSRVFRIRDERVPKDWSEYDFLGFWMYGTTGQSSRVQVCVVSDRAEESKEPKGQKGGKGRATLKIDGFQAEIQPHEGWRYITLSLKENVKGGGTGILHKIGAGDWRKVGGIQFQLPSARNFVTYFDDFVLIKSK